MPFSFSPVPWVLFWMKIQHYFGKNPFRLCNSGGKYAFSLLPNALILDESAFLFTRKCLFVYKKVPFYLQESAFLFWKLEKNAFFFGQESTLSRRFKMTIFWMKMPFLPRNCLIVPETEEHAFSLTLTPTCILPQVASQGWVSPGADLEETESPPPGSPISTFPTL